MNIWRWCPGGMANSLKTSSNPVAPLLNSRIAIAAAVSTVSLPRGRCLGALLQICPLSDSFALVVLTLVHRASKSEQIHNENKYCVYYIRNVTCI